MILTGICVLFSKINILHLYPFRRPSALYPIPAVVVPCAACLERVAAVLKSFLAGLVLPASLPEHLNSNGIVGVGVEIKLQILHKK